MVLKTEKLYRCPIFSLLKVNFQTATTLWKKTSFSIYKPCPDEPDRPETPPRVKTPDSPIASPKKAPQNDAPPNPYRAGPPAPLPPNPVNPYTSPVRPFDGGPTDSMDFFDWVTNRNPNDMYMSENVLFRRK